MKRKFLEWKQPINFSFVFNSEGWDNPFRPDGDLSKEADQIVELIKEGKPINEENLRSKSPSVNESFNISQNNQLNVRKKNRITPFQEDENNYPLPDLVQSDY